jgi:hypothetical protein
MDPIKLKQANDLSDGLTQCDSIITSIKDTIREAQFTNGKDSSISVHTRSGDSGKTTVLYPKLDHHKETIKIILESITLHRAALQSKFDAL